MDGVNANTYTFALQADERRALKDVLAAGNYLPKTVAWAEAAADAPSWRCNVVLYASGKCVVQGKGAREFVENVLEPTVLRRVVLPPEDAAGPAAADPALFYVWGHSFELGSEEDWARLEALCAKFDGRDDVWRATNLEVCRYVLAFRALRCTLDGRVLENPTAVPLCLLLGGRRALLAPGARLEVAP